MSLLKNRLLWLVVSLMVMYLYIHTGGNVTDRELWPVNPSYGYRTTPDYTVATASYEFPAETLLFFHLVTLLLGTIIIWLVPVLIKSERDYRYYL